MRELDRLGLFIDLQEVFTPQNNVTHLTNQSLRSRIMLSDVDRDCFADLIEGQGPLRCCHPTKYFLSQLGLPLSRYDTRECSSESLFQVFGKAAQGLSEVVIAACGADFAYEERNPDEPYRLVYFVEG